MNKENNKGFGLSDLLMIFAIVNWGLNFSIVKIAFREFSPHAFNGLRLLVTSLILMAILGVSRAGFSLPRRELGMAIVIGIVGNTGYQFLFIEGIKRTTASNTSLILSLTPVFVAMMSALLKFERLHWAAWGGIFISFLGLYLVIARGNSGFHFSGQNFRGDLMIFLATIFWALYTVLARPALEKVSALKFTSLTIAIGTFFYLPLAASDIRRLPWREISLGGWAYLLYSAVFALVLGMVIWFISVKRVGNSRTAIYGNITPIFTVLFAHLILSEGLSTFQAAGALVILAGVYLTRAGYRIFEKRPATT